MKSPDVVFLLDCDNTLLDNDRVVSDLGAHLLNEFGPRSRDRYWEIFEELRSELGYTDYLGALQRYRLGAMNDPRLLRRSSFLVDYPFADRLPPSARSDRIGDLPDRDPPACLALPRAGDTRQDAT